jgi:hypothetical protein
VAASVVRAAGATATIAMGNAVRETARLDFVLEVGALDVTFSRLAVNSRLAVVILLCIIHKLI